MKSLRRYADLCLRHEAQTRLLLVISPLLRQRKNTSRSQKNPQKIHTILAPLAQLNSAFQLPWSDSLYEDLSGQELDQFIKYGKYGPQPHQPTKFRAQPARRSLHRAGDATQGWNPVVAALLWDTTPSFRVRYSSVPHPPNAPTPLSYPLFPPQPRGRGKRWEGE
jgi:hypothetical protein